MTTHTLRTELQSSRSFGRILLATAAAIIAWAVTHNAWAQGIPLDGLERLKSFESRRAF